MKTERLLSRNSENPQRLIPKLLDSKVRHPKSQIPNGKPISQWLLRFIFLGGISYLLWHGGVLLRQEIHLLRSYAKLQKEVKQLTLEYNKLKEEYFFYSSQKGKEYFLRKELGYARADEVPFLIVQEETKSEDTLSFSEEVEALFRSFLAKLPMPTP